MSGPQPTQVGELARRAAEVGTGRTLAVDYRVVHTDDFMTALGTWGEEQRHQQGTGQGPDGQPPARVWNVSGFAAAGLGALTFTVPVEEHESSSGEAGLLSAGGHAGRTVLNPSFLHDSTDHIEILLSLGNPPWTPTTADCQTLTRVTVRLLDLAAKCGSVLFMHSPVAPVSDTRGSDKGDGSGEQARDPQGPSLRMSVGVESEEPAARMAFELAVINLADEFGLGLCFADRRFDRVRGEWFTIRKFGGAQFEASTRRSDSSDSARPTRGIVLTSVGPARAGVAQAIARELSRMEIGVLGMSVSSLYGIGFVSFLLPVQAGRHTEEQPDPGCPALPWKPAFEKIESLCAPVVSAPGRPGLPEGYSLVLSAPSPCRFPETSRQTGSAKDAKAPYLIWVAWEAPAHVADAYAVLDVLVTGIRSRTHTWSLDYVQSRLVAPDLMRGRAKFAVQLKPETGKPVGAALQEVAEQVEDHATAAFSAGPGQPSVRVRVSPKERWLDYRRST